MPAGALSAQEGMLGVSEMMSGWYTASVAPCPGNQKPCNYRTGTLTGEEPANDLCQGMTQAPQGAVAALPASRLVDRTGMPGDGGSRHAAVLERSPSSDTARIGNCPAPAGSRCRAGAWEELTGAAVEEKSSYRGTACILKSKIISARGILPTKAGVLGKQFWKSF